MHTRLRISSRRDESGIDPIASTGGYRTSTRLGAYADAYRQNVPDGIRRNRSRDNSNAPRRNPKMSVDSKNLGGVSRRTLLQAGAGLAGGVILPSAWAKPAFAVGVGDKP